MLIKNTIDIEATIDEVWNLTVDVEKLPSVTPTISRVQRLDTEPLKVGSMVELKQPGQPSRVWTVTELEAPHRFVWTTSAAMGMTMAGIHELEETEGGMKNTVAVELDGTLVPVVGLLMRAPIRKALDQENHGFKRAAED